MPLTRSAIRKLKEIVGKEHVLEKEAQLVCYSYDAAVRDRLPDLVVIPGSEDEIAKILTLANAEGFVVVPRGAGTGMIGGSVPIHGGVVVSLSRLNRILAIDEDNLLARVQPGVVTAAFQKEVETRGLFYPPDPSSAAISTMGGNVACCAGGPRAVKYGVTRDYVMGLSAVLPTGEKIRTGVMTAKGVVGYDLTRLLVGSEGTLAVITEITIRLLPAPESVITLTAVYGRMGDAAKTVSALFRAKVVARCIEYMDRAALSAAEALLSSGLPTDAEAVLLIEVDGDRASVLAQAEKVRSVCLENGAGEVSGVEDPALADALWTARKSLSPALFRFGPGKINEDIVVPRNRIPDMVEKIAQLREKTGLFMASFGHAGDGNIHFNIMLDKKDPEALALAHAAVDELFDATVGFSGTLSGEHGVGVTKAPYLAKEIRPAELRLMKEIKKLFDPKGVLNPGKIFPGNSA